MKNHYELYFIFKILHLKYVINLVVVLKYYIAKMHKNIFLFLFNLLCPLKVSFIGSSAHAQKNGISEHKKRHLIETALTLLIHHIWRDVVRTAYFFYFS